jgi:hypothetical protein
MVMCYEARAPFSGEIPHSADSVPFPCAQDKRNDGFEITQTDRDSLRVTTKHGDVKPPCESLQTPAG